MAGIPLSKLEVIQKQIVEHLENGSLMDPFTLKRIISELGNFPEPEKSMFTGLAFGAAGNIDSAIENLKIAVSYGKDFTVDFYISYLSRIPRGRLQREEVLRLSEKHDTLNLNVMGRNLSFGIGDIELMERFYQKLLKRQSSEGMIDYLNSENIKMKNDVQNFLNATSMNKSDVDFLWSTASDIANSRGLVCFASSYFVSGEDDNAYIIVAETDDVNALADMNIELACAIALNDRLSSLPVTSWYRGEL